MNIIYRSKPDDLSIPPMITDPTERAYWNELVQQRGVMNAGDVRVHNYRMSVQEVPIIAGTVSLNNKIYNIWLLVMLLNLNLNSQMTLVTALRKE